MRVYADGVEVPHQVTDSGILARAVGGVAAGATVKWAVLPSRSASSFASQAWVTDTGTYYEMDNGIVACRVPKVIPCRGSCDVGS